MTKSTYRQDLPVKQPTRGHVNGIKRAIGVFGSQTALAAYLNIHPAYVNRWASGKQKIPLHHAETIAKFSQRNPGPRGGIISVIDLRPDIRQFEKYFK